MTEKNKKDNGQGSIKLRADGRWEYQIYIGEINGKTKRKSIYAKTERELKSKIKEFNADRKKFITETDKTPVWELAEFWMKTYKFPNLRGNSRDRLETTYEKHIKPEIGFMIASQITCDDIQRLINFKAKQVSYSYLKKIYQFLNGFFNYLVTRKTITVNPCIGVQMPREENMVVKTKDVSFLSDEEIQRMYEFNDRIKNSQNHFYKYTPIYIFILNTGLRCAEALALEWTDIDFEKRTCSVNKNITLVRSRDKDWNAGKRERLVGETKTASSKRIVPLNEKAIEVLQQVQEYNKRMKIITKYVIASDSGDSITERSLFRSLDYVLGAIGAQHIGIHGLRHTFATVLLKKNIDVSVVSKLLGHKDITTTYRTYIHVIEEQKHETMMSIPSI